jgi:putative transcriptional regulator
MNSISHIRATLKVTQQALADALQVSQGNISHYERGQSVPPEVAKRLIAYAGQRGQTLTFDDIYGKPEPASPTPTPSAAVTSHKLAGEAA